MLGLGNNCTNTGILVREVLQENYPTLQEIEASEPIKYNFDFYEEVSGLPP